MDRQVRWSRLARDEFEEALAYIARDSPARAVAFADRILTEVDSLPQWPYQGHVVDELDDPAYREIPAWPYRIVYRLTDEAVGVVAVMHGARDFGPAWDQPGRTDGPETWLE
jgi:plasmid stabilization system protein ParE